MCIYMYIWLVGEVDLGAASGVRLDAVHGQDAVHHHEEPGGCVVAFPEQHLPCTPRCTTL